MTEGKIAAILDKTSVVINRGWRDAVEGGDVFWIYSTIGPFFDPDTNENLGETKKIWGKVVVSKVEERFCIAETEYAPVKFNQRGFLGVLFGVTEERIELPVNESEIGYDLRSMRIEVGFPALLQKQQKAISSKNPSQLSEHSEEDELEDESEDELEDESENEQLL